jgi:hypothetical protein
MEMADARKEAQRADGFQHDDANIREAWIRGCENRP